MNTMKSYVKQALAFLQGDKAEVIAQKNHRAANNALKGQLAALDGELFKVEGKIEKAEEELAKRKYPTEVIEDGENYIANVASAQAKVKSLKAELAGIQESINFFKELQNEFNADVDA